MLRLRQPSAKLWHRGGTAQTRLDAATRVAKEINPRSIRRYPADRVAAELRSGTDSGAHGTSDMPIWGQVFQSQGTDVAQTRIRKLTEFVESLQQK